LELTRHITPHYAAHTKVEAVYVFGFISPRGANSDSHVW
jgi:hypothetical protein